MVIKLQESLKTDVGQMSRQNRKNMRELLIGVVAEFCTYRDLKRLGIRIIDMNLC